MTLRTQFRRPAIFTRIAFRIQRLFGIPLPPASSVPSSPVTTLVGSDYDYEVKPDAFLPVSDDLLEKILVAGTTNTSTLREGANKLPFELTVSHVARRWRLVSINSTALWSRIDTRYTTHQQLDVLEEYLRRSKDQPLDLRVDIFREHWDADGPLFLELLTANVHRWRRLSITTDFEESKQVIREWLRFLCPTTLEHFSLTCLDVEKLPIIIRDRDFSPQVFVFGAPALSVMRLQGIGMDLLRPPLAPITTLHLEEFQYAPMSYRRFRAMIKALPCLTHLSIYGNLVAVWPRQRTDVDQIPMPALQSLRSYGNDNLYDLLLAIAAPRLESLVLDYLSRLDPRRMCICDDNEPPKFPRLRSLMCSSCYLPPRRISRIFSAFPAVEHFTSLVTRGAGMWSFLRLLRAASMPLSSLSSLSSSPRWRNLRTITIHGMPDEHEYPAETETETGTGTLCDFVEAREATGQPLEKIRLHSDSVESVDIERLRRVVEVEVWCVLERWPRWLSYDDEDDFILRLPRTGGVLG